VCLHRGILVREKGFPWKSTTRLLTDVEAHFSGCCLGLRRGMVVLGLCWRLRRIRHGELGVDWEEDEWAGHG
jgi:hypothetical protein